MLGALGGSSVEMGAVMASLDGEMPQSAGGGVVAGGCLVVAAPSLPRARTRWSEGDLRPGR